MTSVLACSFWLLLAAPPAPPGPEAGRPVLQAAPYCAAPDPQEPPPEPLLDADLFDDGDDPERKSSQAEPSSRVGRLPDAILAESASGPLPPDTSTTPPLRPADAFPAPRPLRI